MRKAREDNINLAVVEIDRKNDPRWMVFTIKGKEVVGIDTSCTSFGAIVQKYGPIPAMPLTQAGQRQPETPKSVTDNQDLPCQA
ncbi:MAG: hypothetical protein Q7R39_04325 [Dehalococcoidia bacterium]|nr:hypothetical protein [Dehalococcoidia bacterium]